MNLNAVLLAYVAFVIFVLLFLIGFVIGGSS